MTNTDDAVGRAVQQALPYNFTVNVLEGAAFWLGMSFASTVTVLPLFVSRLTTSSLAIGLIPALSNAGWLLPQLFTAYYVQRLERTKPVVLLTTLNERLPFLGMAALALLVPRIEPTAGLLGFFGLLTWFSVGGGFTATPWQEMVARIIPARRRGSFFGAQSLLGGLLAAGGAALAGRLLETYPYPQNFALCFGLAFVSLMASFFLLALTREPAHPPVTRPVTPREYWRKLPDVLRRDPNFARYVGSRAASSLGVMGVGFLSVFAVRELDVTVNQVGLLTAASLAAQTAGNAVLGVWGDRGGHKQVLELAALSSAGAMLFAWWARSPVWLYAAYVLAGVATAGNLISALAIVLEFGPPEERPTYIGLTNSMIAPFAGLSPVLAGWITEVAGYRSTFATAAAFALLGWAILHWEVRDPRRRQA